MLNVIQRIQWFCLRETVAKTIKSVCFIKPLMKGLELRTVYSCKLSFCFIVSLRRAGVHLWLAWLTRAAGPSPTSDSYCFPKDSLLLCSFWETTVLFLTSLALSQCFLSFNMYMGVLPLRMSMHKCACPATGVNDDVSHSCGCLKCNLGPLEEQIVLLNCWAISPGLKVDLCAALTLLASLKPLFFTSF